MKTVARLDHTNVTPFFLRRQMYMSSWYLPPCSDDDRVEYWYHHATTSPDTLFVRPPYAEPGVSTPVLRIESSTEIGRMMIHPTRDMISSCLTSYCNDTARFLFSALDWLNDPATATKTDPSNIPLVLQYGDAEPFQAMTADLVDLVWYPHVPVVKKFRYAMTKAQLDSVTATTSGGSTNNATCLTSVDRRVANVADPAHRSQAIITVLNYNRHFHILSRVAADDTAWENKKNVAVWRGALTGTNRILREERTDEDWCNALPRCQVALQYGSHSSQIDAKLVGLHQQTALIAPTIAGVELYGEPLSMAEMLSYKMIIMVEGNDVSSGLKWALYSNSVVLMAPPTFTSWAMEELLEPWVHYIPIDGTNILERVEWVVTHDAEARRIARRGQLWIHDLVYHDDAVLDNSLVVQETMRRMLVHWKAVNVDNEDDDDDRPYPKKSADNVPFAQTD
jgi:Glycosyl transferase family 90